jgi:hypothetical protein
MDTGVTEIIVCAAATLLLLPHYLNRVTDCHCNGTSYEGSQVTVS